MASAAHRIVRCQRIFRRAAEIIERDAAALRDSHTICGRWRIDTPADRLAKNDVDEALKIAGELRRMGGEQ